MEEIKLCSCARLAAHHSCQAASIKFHQLWRKSSGLASATGFVACGLPLRGGHLFWYFLETFLHAKISFGFAIAKTAASHSLQSRVFEGSSILRGNMGNPNGGFPINGWKLGVALRLRKPPHDVALFHLRFDWGTPSWTNDNKWICGCFLLNSQTKPQKEKTHVVEQTLTLIHTVCGQWKCPDI